MVSIDEKPPLRCLIVALLDYSIQANQVWSFYTPPPPAGDEVGVGVVVSKGSPCVAD